jgi:hypothetical protein
MNKMTVDVSNDGEKGFIEIDFNSLEQDKFYLVSYQDEKYAVRKTSNHELETYDVIE